MSDWRPGYRHQVELAVWRVLWSPEARLPDPIWRWRCLDCGQDFSWWPSDDEECPGPGEGEGERRFG